jgi:hypothetical protein
MQKFLFIFFILSSLVGFSQTDTASLKAGNRMLITDSSISIQSKITDSLAKLRQAEDQKRWEDNNAGNINSLVHLNSERVAKEKRNAYLRIGLGIFFFVILIIGLRRRTKKS